MLYLTLKNCLMNVGLVLELDGQLPHSPSHKHHHLGGAVCCYWDMAVANQPGLPPRSLFGMGWVRAVYKGFI